VDAGRGNCREIWKGKGFILGRDLVEVRMTKGLLKLRKKLGRRWGGWAEWIFNKPSRSWLGLLLKREIENFELGIMEHRC